MEKKLYSMRISEGKKANALKNCPYMAKYDTQRSRQNASENLNLFIVFYKTLMYSLSFTSI